MATEYLAKRVDPMDDDLDYGLPADYKCFSLDEKESGFLDRRPRSGFRSSSGGELPDLNGGAAKVISGLQQFIKKQRAQAVNFVNQQSQMFLQIINKLLSQRPGNGDYAQLRMPRLS